MIWQRVRIALLASMVALAAALPVAPGKAAASATTQPTAWKLAEARYRDIIGDSGAT